jgi:hypothetical protein
MVMEEPAQTVWLLLTTDTVGVALTVSEYVDCPLQPALLVAAIVYTIEADGLTTMLDEFEDPGDQLKELAPVAVSVAD